MGMARDPGDPEQERWLLYYRIARAAWVSGVVFLGCGIYFGNPWWIGTSIALLVLGLVIDRIPPPGW